MPSLNKVMLIGNLTQDPELRRIPSGTAVSTLRARPSMTGSPQPVTPSSVSIFRNIQRGGRR